MSVSTLIAMLQRFDGSLPVTVMVGDYEAPLTETAEAIVTIEGGGAAPAYVAINCDGIIG